MKLITEHIDASFIEEAVEGQPKKLFIEGIFLMGDIKNRNGRLYPMSVLEKEVNRYNEQYVKQSGAYGELGHPQGPTINPDRISHIIKSLTKEGSNYIGKAEVITENNMGGIVKNILAHGGRLGVSSRGMGSLVEKGGINEVQGDFYLATAADIVTDPSAPSAFVNGIYESLEWVFDERLGWKAIQTAERIQETFKKEKPAAITEERKLKAFETWLSQIAGQSTIIENHVSSDSENHYAYAHGKKPRGSGMWMFSKHKAHDFQSHSKDDLFSHNGSYTEAKTKASAWAKAKGCIAHLQS